MIGQKFIYKKAGVQSDDKTVYFQFQIITNEQTFDLEETLEFPISIYESYETKQLIRALHLSLGMSYYKTFVPPEIIHPYAMTQLEASFWNTVFKNGYGEFLYKNNTEPASIAQFNAQDGEDYSNDNDSKQLELSENAILGIGGGKDSIVAGELLKELGIPITGFVQATGEILGQTQSVADVMGVELLAVKRVIDKQITELNKLEGAKNGHIPISLIFGLVGSLLAIINRSSYLVVANESSASIPQAKLGDLDINHQWSKSIQFERLFQDYIHTYVSKDLTYFSAIRPMQSILVAKQFAQFPQYLNVFTSDNSLFKIEQTAREHPRWSTNSSKSLSSFILLAPCVDSDKLIEAFGRNFLDLPELENLMTDLLGFGENVVLDCVGTPQELLASFNLLILKSDYEDSYLVKFIEENYDLNSTKSIETLTMLEENVFPEKLKDKLLKLIGDIK